MEHARPLPRYLVSRYRGWKATEFAENKAWYQKLASEGQHPRAMIISCCDSRVHVSSLFGAGTGEFFIHRNIANLVPAWNPDGDLHGTSAAIEYAVGALGVAHLLVMGHSQCGGVKGCHDMCMGNAPELESGSSFVGRWMELLRPGFDEVRDIDDADARIKALEHEGVRISLQNLMTFPFVESAVRAETLTLHGLWHDIGSGRIEVYDGVKGVFEPL